VTGPDELRARFARHTAPALVAKIAALRPRPGGAPGYAARIARRSARSVSLAMVHSAAASRQYQH